MGQILEPSLRHRSIAVGDQREPAGGHDGEIVVTLAFQSRWITASVTLIFLQSRAAWIALTDICFAPFAYGSQQLEYMLIGVAFHLVPVGSSTMTPSGNVMVM